MSALRATWVEQFPALRRLEVLDSQWSIDAIAYADLQQRLEYCFVGATEALQNDR
jgi:hypothetical protein